VEVDVGSASCRPAIGSLIDEQIEFFNCSPAPRGGSAIDDESERAHVVACTTISPSIAMRRGGGWLMFGPNADQFGGSIRASARRLAKTSNFNRAKTLVELRRLFRGATTCPRFVYDIFNQDGYSMLGRERFKVSATDPL